MAGFVGSNSIHRSIGPQVPGQPLLSCPSSFSGRLPPGGCPWKLQAYLSHIARNSQLKGRTSFPVSPVKVPGLSLIGLAWVTFPTQRQSSWPRG